MDFTGNSISVKFVMKFIMKSTVKCMITLKLIMESTCFSWKVVLFTFHVFFMCFSLFRCFHFSGMLFMCFSIFMYFSYAFHFSGTSHFLGVLFSFHVLFSFLCFSCAFHKKYQFSYKKHHFLWKPTEPGQYVCIHATYTTKYHQNIRYI